MMMLVLDTRNQLEPGSFPAFYDSCLLGHRVEKNAARLSPFVPLPTSRFLPSLHAGAYTTCLSLTYIFSV